MVLIISESDQIIGADEEFLENSSLEEIKEKFPSMSIFTLQSSIGEFDFNYQDKTYIVNKISIIMDEINANIYIFNDKNSSISSVSNETLEENIQTIENLNNNLDIPISNNDTTTSSTDSSLDMELDIPENKDNDEKSSETTVENNLDLGLTLSLDNDTTTPSTDSSLDMELDIPENKDNNEKSSETTVENNLDLGLTLSLDNDTTTPSTDSSLDMELDIPENKDEKINLSLDIEPKEDENKTNETKKDEDEDEENNLEIDITLCNDTNLEDDKSLEIDLNNTKEELQFPKLDLGLDLLNQTPSTPKLDLGLDNINTTSDNSETLDLGLKHTKHSFSITEADVQKDLEQASRELSIDNDTIKEFFKDFTNQLKDEKEIFMDAIKNKDFDTIHKSAHKLKGVALNLRLSKFANLLKQVDELAKANKNIEEIEDMLVNLYDAIEEDDGTRLTINIYLPPEEKEILLKSLLQFLEENRHNSNIKEDILNAYNLIPVEELKEIESCDDKNINKFIENLIKKVKKEIK